MATAFEIGDRVVYSMPKVSPSPGQRAQQIHPSVRGESYEYVVEKHWAVKSLPTPSTIEIITRRGKTRTINVHDPRLRRANWFERLLLGARFPRTDSSSPTA